MPKMVKFRLNRECRDISVNPAKVLYVCHYEHGASSVHFSKDCFVRVQGELEDVARILEAALGESSADLVSDPGSAAVRRPGSEIN